MARDKPMADVEVGAQQPDEVGASEAIRAARRELDDATNDLERLTNALRERTEQVTTLRMVTDALLDAMSHAAVVVDADGKVTAVSREAAREHPSLAEGLGKDVSAVLPEQIDHALRRFQTNAATVQPSSEPAKLIALTDGSVLVLLTLSEQSSGPGTERVGSVSDST